MTLNYIAEATSRPELRKFAEIIRKAFNICKPYFPAIEILEKGIVQFYPEFDYEIVPDEELDGIEGLTLPNDNLIILPERVYYGAIAGNGRARFSVTHEISHYILIKDTTVAMCRPDVRLPPYKKPEWQANTLASELLIPPNLSVGMCTDEIAEIFGVSRSAANVHLNVKKKEYLP